eukprot:15159238-Alexandrium_andersonii.AAC.1
MPCLRTNTFARARANACMRTQAARARACLCPLVLVKASAPTTNMWRMCDPTHVASPHHAERTAMSTP